MRQLLSAFTIAIAASSLAASTATRPSHANGLVVHEWGTFTSLAGPDGNAVRWAPQIGTDLPCFVERNRFNIKGNLSGTVRMETPVIYFYASQPTTVDVSVRFRQGVITEWFPRASSTPGPSVQASESRIAWRNVKILPGADERFPLEQDASHYYAARHTEAAPLEIGSQREKFLFYRGVGWFAVPIAVPTDEDGRAHIAHPPGQPIGDAIVFTSHGGRVAYEVRHEHDDPALDVPVVHDQLPTLELERLLIENGLYPAEAAAMLETWRDTWFVAGTRVFYIVPRAAIDMILPLQITPPPASLARVFVGRVELGPPPAAQQGHARRFTVCTSAA